MNKILLMALLFSFFFSKAQKDKLPEKDEVMMIMESVANWQLNEKLNHKLTDWTNGALYAGMMEFAKIANDQKYMDWLIDKGNKTNWEPHKRQNMLDRYHADDYAVGIMYLEMFHIKGNGHMLDPILKLLNTIHANPSTVGLDFAFHRHQRPIERWSWCDALFMAPPVWAKAYGITGEPKYLDFMYKEYKATADFLYDHKEHLFFRDSRYFHQKEPNGQKMFWGRGNGWVLGGLPIILEELPDTYNEKMWFEKLFVDMATRIASLQDETGYWHASMLDQESYPNPETSSSGFFIYSLAWGINNGYLDYKKFQPVVLKGWNALTEAVFPDGKLGWVQPIGENPKNTTKEMTEVYGVGAFLLAGTEIYKLLK